MWVGGRGRGGGGGERRGEGPVNHSLTHLAVLGSGRVQPRGPDWTQPTWCSSSSPGLEVSSPQSSVGPVNPGRLLAPAVLSRGVLSRGVQVLRGWPGGGLGEADGGQKGPGALPACGMPRQTTLGRLGHGQRGLRGPGETGPWGKQCQDHTLQ